MLHSLRGNILVGYGASFGILLLVLLGALNQLVYLGRTSESLLSGSYQSIRAAQDMISAVERQDSGALRYLARPAETDVRQFQAQRSVFSGALTRAKDHATSQEEQALVARIDSAYSDYLATFSRVRRTASPETQPMDRYREDVLPAFQEVREASIKLRDLNHQTLVAESNSAATVGFWSALILGGIGLMVLAGGVVLTLFVSRRLEHAVAPLQKAAQRIADGDYDISVESPVDDFDPLADRLNELAVHLQQSRDQRAEEERKVAALLRSVRDGLIVTDATLAVQNVNPAAASVLGLDARAATGEPLQRVVPDEAPFEPILAAAEDALAEDASDHDLDDVVAIEHNDTTRYYQPAITSVDSAEQELGIVLLLRDVTKSETTLKTKLEELNALKSQFIAALSRHLQAPLRSIKLRTGLLKEQYGNLPGRGYELLSDTIEDIADLLTFADDLSVISRIETGQMDMEIAPVSVDSLFRSATRAFASKAEEKGIPLSTEVPDDVPDVRADSTLVSRVLSNLIANALRHTEAGGRIRLRAEQSEQTVELSVADTGEGIPVSLRSTIFDPFTHGEDAQSSRTGLGLAVCKEIVEAHGGRIWVDSTPNEGSTFTFTLRVANAARTSGLSLVQ